MPETSSYPGCGAEPRTDRSEFPVPPYLLRSAVKLSFLVTELVAKHHCTFFRYSNKVYRSQCPVGKSRRLSLLLKVMTNWYGWILGYPLFGLLQFTRLRAWAFPASVRTHCLWKSHSRRSDVSHMGLLLFLFSSLSVLPNPDTLARILEMIKSLNSRFGIRLVSWRTFNQIVRCIPPKLRMFDFADLFNLTIWRPPFQVRKSLIGSGHCLMPIHMSSCFVFRKSDLNSSHYVTRNDLSPFLPSLTSRRISYLFLQGRSAHITWKHRIQGHSTCSSLWSSHSSSTPPLDILNRRIIILLNPSIFLVHFLHSGLMKLSNIARASRYVWLVRPHEHFFHRPWWIFLHQPAHPKPPIAPPPTFSCFIALKCDLRDDPRTLKGLAKLGQRPVDYEQVRCPLFSVPLIPHIPNLTTALLLLWI